MRPASDTFVDLNTLDGVPRLEHLDLVRGLVHSVQHCRDYHRYAVRRISIRRPSDLRSVAGVLKSVGDDYIALHHRCLKDWAAHDRAFEVARNDWFRHDSEREREIRERVMEELRGAGRLIEPSVATPAITRATKGGRLRPAVLHEAPG